MYASFDFTRKIVPATETQFIVPVSEITVTWDPTLHGSDITLSEGNLVAARDNAGVNWYSVYSTLSQSSGKRYFEVQCVVAPAVNNPGIGFSVTGGDYDPSVNDHLLGSGFGVNSIGCYNFGITLVIGFTGILNPNSFSVSPGDVLSAAIDLDAGRVWFAFNNDFTFSGTNPTSDPSTNTDPMATFTPPYDLFPALSMANSQTYSYKLFASGTFNFTPPTGFVSWSA